MYKDYWGLMIMPFENTPNPHFFYHSGQHEEALARMLYTVQRRKGCAMLTGVFGCGKTAIGQVLAEELMKEKYKTAFITNPRLDDIEFLRMITYLLGISNPATRKADILISLNEVLLNNMKEGKETVIIIDEAHSIERDEIFEELRLLLNFQLKDRFLLTLLLFGQPELNKKIEQHRQFEQRINIKCHLGSLDFSDTAGYIRHRLDVAGASRQLFKEEAVKLIFEYSGGIPRRINRLCDICLLNGFSKGVSLIDETIVQEEIKGLSQV
jgi:general secretion pathway protein A